MWGNGAAWGLPPLDGARHLERKRNFLRTTDVEALERYLPTILARISEAIGDREGLRVVGDRFVFASEVLFDGLGDEDGLCESGEACTLDPNLGAHQGEAGDGIVDEVIGFELAPPVRNAPPRVEDVHLDARVGL